MARSNEFSNFQINQYTDISHKYELIKQIGRGSFGDVLEAIDVKTREKYQLLLFYSFKLELI